MSTNIVHEDATQLSLPIAAHHLSAGDPYLFGNQPCVALTDKGSTHHHHGGGGGIEDEATLKFNGSARFELSGASAEDPVYIDTDGMELSLDDADGPFFGVCITDSDDDDMVTIRIGGIPPTFTS